MHYKIMSKFVATIFIQNHYFSKLGGINYLVNLFLILINIGTMCHDHIYIYIFSIST